MLPDIKVKSLQAELDKMRLQIEKIKTGGWRIPPHGDPFWNKVQELNKALEVVAKG